MLAEPTDVDVESAVVARLLDPPDACTLGELRDLIRDVPDELIYAAVRSLSDAQVVVTEGDGVRASSALRRLDALGLVAL